MTLEIPEAVLEVIKDVVRWSRGSNGHGEVSQSDVLLGAPILDDWCVARGLLPPGSPARMTFKEDATD
jgi:hypothetical protein